MGLSEQELVDVYTLLGRAELAELVALSGLVQSFVEAGVKESQESLALVLDRYEKGKEAKK